MRMVKIGFVGSPATGKTTVAQSFASKLRFDTEKRVELIDEYARWFVSTFGETSVFDQYLISHRQIDREISAIKKGVDYLITDSPAFLSLIYAYMGLDWNDKKQVNCLNELYRILEENFHSHDKLFYFPPFKKTNSSIDGHRIHTEQKELEDIDEKIRGFMKIHKIDFIELGGTLDERVQKAYGIVLGIK